MHNNIMASLMDSLMDSLEQVPQSEMQVFAVDPMVWPLFALADIDNAWVRSGGAGPLVKLAPWADLRDRPPKILGAFWSWRASTTRCADAHCEPPLQAL